MYRYIYIYNLMIQQFYFWVQTREISSFFIFGCAAQHVGSQFPDQGWNPRPLQWKRGVLTTGPPRRSQEKLVLLLFLNLFIFIYLWLCWVFIAVCGLSLVVVSGGYSSLRCAGFSLRWLLLLRNTGSRSMGFSSCGSWAQQLWHTGLVALPVGSSRTRARTCVPCIGRWILNQCTTREVREISSYVYLAMLCV